MKDLSGPAFPGQWYDVNLVGDTVVRESWIGMTKRELIATGQMKAWRQVLGHEPPSETIARYAREDADALLAELGRG